MAGKKKSVNYLSNENLLREIRISKENLKNNPTLTNAQALTPALVGMLRMLVQGVSMKYCFRNYSYIEDMRGDAAFSLCQNALKFNEEKTQNPFSYYTQIVWSCFISALDKEKKVARIRDALLEDQEMTPSFRRQAENEEQQRETREPVFKKTAETERQEIALKKSLEACNLALKAMSSPEQDREALLLIISEAFDHPVDATIFEFPAMTEKLFPKGTTWEIDTEVPPDYGVIALVRVNTTTGTKLSKGLTETKFQNNIILGHDIAPVLVRMALSVRKDTLVFQNKGLSEVSLKWGGKGNGYAAPRRAGGNGQEDFTVSAIDKKKRRGRKPKAKVES